MHRLKNKNEIRTPATTIEQDQINQISNSIIPNTIEHPINQMSDSTDSTIPNTNKQSVNNKEQYEESNEPISTSISNVRNFSKVTGRGRPSKYRYVSSIERKQICSGDSAYSRSSTCSESLTHGESSTGVGSSARG
ncbi:5302_t:CDS:2 [Dentiscutata erythropus]|uniref:5302_t:CDS:1 n=1 Tax=Dentiscutata erythropus TaxID=1348616 RepID=A0A9N9DJ50_9GLOM|nr:5302_t:CDS:2 [Dentiscutata erythropus]